MSLFKLDKSYFDTFSILTKPKRFFASSSHGLTGSIPVFPFSSLSIKDVDKIIEGENFSEQNVESLREEILKNSVNFSSLENYMTAVNNETKSSRFKKDLEVLRFEPSVSFTSDTVRKNVIRNILYPYYRSKYGKACNWAFTNYNTLNFFSTADNTVPEDAVLIYPATGSYKYRPTGSFSFDFYINPRYSQPAGLAEYKAGTIFHLSSSYALSLVSGSSRDKNGDVDGFRLLLQLSHSAELTPSECPLNLSGPLSPPYNFIFSSSDNSLSKNKWHHCCVRWDNNTQNSTGSFVVDGRTVGTFIIPTSALSGSYLQRELPSTVVRNSSTYNLGPPDTLFIGNFYDGPNSDGPTTEDFTAQFFNPDIAHRDGLINYYGPTVTHESISKPGEPGIYSFSHPLNAEVHDLKIYNKYRTDSDIEFSRKYGIENLRIEVNNGLLFYVPPFFIKDTNEREILQTPFQTARGSTDDPFNVPLSFGVGGHYLNLENFVKEFVEGNFPRLLNLSGSTIDDQTGWTTANNYLFTTGSVRKRNLTVLPNDNGLFIPSFEILLEDSENEESLSLFVNDAGVRQLSMVNLSELLPTASIGAGLLGTENPGSIAQALQGASPDDPSIPTGTILTIYNRTKDPSSNEIVVFDASNLFYGNKIDPGSFSLTDSAVTGSGGRVSITLKDCSGSLYRADSITPHAKWAAAGSLLYEEGIATVHTPLIPRFGVDQFETSFAGQQNIHMLRIDVPAERAELNFSTNPAYKKLAPTDKPVDIESNFTYITNVNLHDENLNIITKTNFSQALIKRENDRYVIRIKLDF